MLDDLNSMHVDCTAVCEWAHLDGPSPTNARRAPGHRFNTLHKRGDEEGEGGLGTQRDSLALLSWVAATVARWQVSCQKQVIKLTSRN